MIDSEQKRRAVLRVLPRPDDGVVEAGDRAHIWVYRGLFDLFAALDAVFFGHNA